MLLFLGSWRSTVIVMTSIPLSLLVSIIVLNGWTDAHLMTLGGWRSRSASSVDDATVEVENFHRQHRDEQTRAPRDLDGRRRSRFRRFVSHALNSASSFSR